MARAWKVIGIFVLILLVVGALCIGVGMLTGGSVQRMLESYFGDYETFELVKDTIISSVNEIASSVN